MEQFGCDKPDLRNPLRLTNVTEFFKGSGLQIFEKLIEKGAIVNCIEASQSQGKPRSFYDNLNKWAIDQGKKGLGYINFENNEAKGPLAKNFNPEKLQEMINKNNFNNQQIAHTQPRRVAAVSLAQRISDECNTKLGEYIGYTSKV